MKIKSILSMLAVVMLCSSSFGQTNWVSRFLEGYPRPQSPPGTAPATVPAVPLSGMVHNGAISLSTQDIIRLLLENNRDLTVSRIVPISSLYSIASLFRPFQPNFHVIGAATRTTATAQRIVIEVRNAYTQLEMNRSRITTARTARELAARRLDAEQKKFELGTSTVRFVLEEQRNVAQAETNEIQALVNYTKAVVAFDRAIGNNLARNNIELDKQLPEELASSN